MCHHYQRKQRDRSENNDHIVLHANMLVTVEALISHGNLHHCAYLIAINLEVPIPASLPHIIFHLWPY